MYKHALLLTAATMALLSGTAFAADNDSDITTKVTTNLKTSTANAGAPSNILIEANGSVVVTSTTPDIEIDSSNIVTNKGTISNIGTQGATGIQLDTGNVGGFDNIGVIDLTGSGINKVGISITNPTGGANTVFTGTMPLPDATTAVTRPTAIYLEAGSTMTVTGDGSTGILLNSADSITGDVIINGAMTINPSTAGSTSGGNDIGASFGGTLNGNFTVGTTGSISAFGSSAHGVILIGELNGIFTNMGTIEALGTTTVSTTAVNPEAGSAVVVENSITGGFYNAGPTTSSNSATIGRATIAESGDEGALDIIVGSAPTANLEIGTLTDATDPGFSLVNRGDIAVTTLGPNLNATAVQFGGTSSFGVVLDGKGFFNGGAINATSTNDIKQLTPTSVTAISVGGYTTIPMIDNSNESGGGTITASLTGAEPAVATAIDILANASLGEIDNSGTISASATSTDNTIAGLSAFAIRDETVGGTLTKIVNSGSIVASVTTLTNGLQVGSAIDLTDSSQSVTITNTGTIGGAIALGSGNDSITTTGTGPNTPATMVGNINFGGGTDTLVIGATGGGNPANVTGAIQEALGGTVDITVNQGSSLILKNDGIDTNNGLGLTANTPVTNLHVFTGGTLGLTLAQAFNVDATAAFQGPVVVAPSNTGMINIESGALMPVTFGTFIGSTNTSDSSEFVLLDTRGGNLTIGNVPDIANQIAGPGKIPFLFTGNVCTYNVGGAPVADQCTAAEPISTTDSELVLTVTPKTAANLGLTGYAAKMFPLANAALANDNGLGAAVISAGSGIDATTASGIAEGNALYQKIYGSFAPDVTGSQRALAVALTDQATGAVGARQRALRMYAAQDGDASMWGQEFTERLNVGNQTAAGGFSDSGFGFALGMDGGSPADGRYGGAFTFYSGDTSEKDPRDSKTTSEWYMATGYTDWRGKGFFLDSQLSVGYGNIDGRRFFDFGGVSRTAEGRRAALMASGGVTAGVAMTAGGTVIMPQISIDGLTMRQEGYTETNHGQTTTQGDDAFDLQVRQEYDNSLRAFGGLDIRQDLNFGDFFLQPEGRIGYRYDFLNAAQKLDAQFVCSTVGSANGGCPATAFSITGPDPAKGNLVAGGSISTTTGAWSIGLNYDYIRGFGNGGNTSVTQDGTITLVGRI